MNNFLELALTRRSIRKFADGDIPSQDIEYFIKSAVSAPSGCNSQCWNFVAVKDRNIINKLEEVVVEKLESLLASKKESIPTSYLESKRKMVGFFKNAPLVIAVFMTQAEYYDPIMISTLKEKGFDSRAIMDLFANYDILSVGAAIQNLLLAVQEKGYGACWMNEPAIAADNIKEILSIPVNQKFISLIPIGIPAYIPREKKMKDLKEVFQIR